MAFTTIRIQTELRDQLKTLGRKGETYDDIIRRLVSDALQAGSRTKTPAEARTSRAPLMPSDLA